MMAAAAGGASRQKLATQTDKHEIKKSSYYVWFLGAKESKGLRGEEYITPVVRYLIGREKEHYCKSALKVALRVTIKNNVGNRFL